MKFVSLLKTKMKGTPLTSEDIGRAKMYWVKVFQRTLVQNKPFEAWIQQLRLCAGQDGV